MYLHAAVILASSFLLFQIQPMITKMILPWFGGSASVWITAMLFFQLMLLAGYLYAHWSIRALTPRTQAFLHAVLLLAGLLFLPILPSLAWKPAGNEEPIFRILGLLFVTIGLPYFLLSTTSPLIQAWHARKFKSALPYKLFGLSNLASLAGLLAYPFVVEPHVTLHQQSLGWSIGFAAFACLGMLAAFRNPASIVTDRPHATEEVVDNAPQPTVREMVLWLLLAACASTLLLAVTNHLTQNVASIPFLWVLPLGLYLLTFILTFDFERFYRKSVFIWLMLAALAAMAYGLYGWNSHTSLKLVIPVFSAGLFIACLFFHGELVLRKPAPRHLTSFYLVLSIGGAVGGLLVGLVAPLVLPAYFELPLALVLCSLLLLFILGARVHRATIAVAATVAAGVVIASGAYIFEYQKAVRVMARNFYGGLRIHDYDKGSADEMRMIVHGTVTHGMQYTKPERRRELISYYGPGSGVYLAEKALRHSSLRVGVIGLGAGSLAAYAQPGDVFRFYEINPLVEKLARSEFTFLADCRGKADVVLGDGRLSLEREPDQQFDLLIVDAFSGDAIPVHLLTREAMQLYFRHLKPGGILALHITNTHLDLEPVVEKLSAALSKHALLVANEPTGKRNQYRSRWALVSSSPITSHVILENAEDLETRSELGLWTDEYNNLFQILK
jgi:hypothetical protein